MAVLEFQSNATVKEIDPVGWSIYGDKLAKLNTLLWD